MITNIFSIINSFQDRYPVDVDGLAQALGIEVNYAFLSPSISGMIERTVNDDYFITINANDTKTRQRFTLAHELGHFIYHKDKMGLGIYDDRMYRSTDIGKYHNTRIGAKEETQANKFAVSLLMPVSAITELKAQGITDPDSIADKLGVSKQAMRIRLRSSSDPS